MGVSKLSSPTHPKVPAANGFGAAGHYQQPNRPPSLQRRGPALDTSGSGEQLVLGDLNVKGKVDERLNK